MTIITTINPTLEFGCCKFSASETFIIVSILIKKTLCSFHGLFVLFFATIFFFHSFFSPIIMADCNPVNHRFGLDLKCKMCNRGPKFCVCSKHPIWCVKIIVNDTIDCISTISSKNAKRLKRKKNPFFPIVPCLPTCPGCLICLLNVKSVQVKEMWEKSKKDRISSLGQFIWSRMVIKKKKEKKMISMIPIVK